ncbi:PD-(D/E)XK nuclease superfamily protein [Butyrivibrio sp. ob235]|uniref:AAA family ATPase n=1 Tax=Butyrivibrio sp. ob235 TaxID=1761780 RepID=UPI0008B20C88|nr:AAA family ATPase [Butyrivibrio sp. ob235]SEL96881.1 PD-(D/E)XK nuclease superfamily protein [Butyrivibrio sp. ob235]
MKPINTTISTFKNLIEADYVYVDKTEYIYNMVREPFGQYFFSRPRRFGKSLTVSILEAIFSGEKELFKGLYIYGTDYSFEEYPIIHLDFGRSDSTNKKKLEDWINRELREIADKNEISIKGSSPALLFGELIKGLYNKYGKGVVILIDEYDRPITNNVEEGKRVHEIRIMMEAFYQMINGYESMERFVFLTGITRLSQVSIFSKLNNLDDISRKTDYAGMVGYTNDELDRYFAEYLDDGAKKTGCTKEELKSKLAYWYDGFKFTFKDEKVYNPVSIGQFFNNNCEYRNYWYATATPTMLVEQAKKQKLSVEDIENAFFTEVSYSSFDVTTLSGDELNTQMLIQLLFQSGYLTFGERIEGIPTTAYKLVYPNYEVQMSFEMELASIYVGQGVQEINSVSIMIQQAAAIGNVAKMMDLLKSLIAGIPYNIQVKHEKYYQSMIYLIFKMCGMDVESECVTNIGRIDAVMRAANNIYIIECKLDKSPEKAIEQIYDMKYAQKYLIEKEKGKSLVGIGIDFSYADGIKNIRDYKEIEL